MIVRNVKKWERKGLIVIRFYGLVKNLGAPEGLLSSFIPETFYAKPQKSWSDVKPSSSYSNNASKSAKVSSIIRLAA